MNTKAMTTSNVNFGFFGTDPLATAVLDELQATGLYPSLIVTTPDRPQGRKLVQTPSPVKTWALHQGISYIQPESLYQLPPELASGRLDITLVASYGRIIPKPLLDIPAYGFLNIHPSLLPKYRGATPLESAILSGDAETGVTLIQMDEKMDHGPIVAQEKFELIDQDYFTLRQQSAICGARMFMRILPALVSGKIQMIEQNHAAATYTRKITKTDGQIDLGDSADLNWRKYRAFIDWPGTYFFTEKNGQKMRVIVKKARFENERFVVERVVPEGKKETSWEEFQKNL